MMAKSEENVARAKPDNEQIEGTLHFFGLFAYHLQPHTIKVGGQIIVVAINSKRA